MQKEYGKAYKEVLEILRHMSKEEQEKIPSQMIKTFEEKMDKNYIFKYDENKTFEEQELLIETKAILANIFRDYWASQEQKEKIIAKQNYDRIKAEEENREKYNPDNLFKKKVIDENEEKQEQTGLIVYKETILQKILNKFKKLFHLN